MSGSGSAVSRTHHGGGDRFYNPPAVRKQQQLMLQKQQEQEQRISEPENRAGSDGVAALSRVGLVRQPVIVSNLDRFLESVTPVVQARFSSEGQRNGRNQEPEYHLYYKLGDLWEVFGEWSAYGVGVPLVLNGKESIVQYYVPFLSGMQLYVDPVNPPSRCRRSGDEGIVVSSRETSSGASQQVLNSLGRSGIPMIEEPITSSSIDEVESCLSPGMLVFDYMEEEMPYNRRPLADKISALASHFPELRNYNSSDLLPSSWLSVAWYPIYRIPVGPTLKDLKQSFITFHSLSTNAIGTGQPRSRIGVGGFGGPSKIPLPVFGLASCKLGGSILSPFGPLECQQENPLLQAADTWLRNLKVFNYDYQFFMSHHHHHHHQG